MSDSAPRPRAARSSGGEGKWRHFIARTACFVERPFTHGPAALGWTDPAAGRAMRDRSSTAPAESRFARRAMVQAASTSSLPSQPITADRLDSAAVATLGLYLDAPPTLMKPFACR
jgi:hypothetical protein